MSLSQDQKSIIYEIFDIDPDEQWQGPCASNPQAWDAPEADNWNDETNPYYQGERDRVDEAKRICNNECPVLEKCNERLWRIKGRVSGVIAGNLIEFRRMSTTEVKQV